MYKMTIKGELDAGWLEWLGGIELRTTTDQDGMMVTTLIHPAPDQPALFGLLETIRDFNLVLISVTRIDTE